MDVGGVIERVQRVAAVRADTAANPGAIASALRASSELRAWLAAGDAELTCRLKPQVSFPEKTIADCTRGSLHDATRASERADTLAAVPSFADALDDMAVTPAHVDAITKATRGLDSDQRAELLERVSTLVPVATAATVREFGRRLDLEVRAVQRDDGMAKLERQQRATSMRTWTDGDGMVCINSRLDPLLGLRVVARIDAEVQALFAESVPDTCPTDPIDKQRRLMALALARLVTGDGVGAAPGRPEYVVVVDSSQPDGGGGPLVDWGLPVEVPTRVLAGMMIDGDVHVVVVRNGVVLHAPDALDLGRTTRLANRAQRRALRAMYATCAIPGCSVSFDRCKIHHVRWWRHGGATDLANLLPVCAHHHSKIHDGAWSIELGTNRNLTLRLPDGTIHATGPPSRRAA